jgi:hypothetical protein
LRDYAAETDRHIANLATAFGVYEELIAYARAMRNDEVVPAVEQTRPRAADGRAARPRQACHHGRGAACDRMTSSREAGHRSGKSFEG